MMKCLTAVMGGDEVGGGDVDGGWGMRDERHCDAAVLYYELI